MTAQAACDRWNAAHPPGTPVVVRRDSGERTETVTRSAAGVLGGALAVIWLKGISGAYPLGRVSAAEVA